MGARLAVDRLGRMAPGKKRARSWSGETVPEDMPRAAPDSQVPGTPVKSNPGTRVGPNTPPSDAGPVRIKTREPVHDAPVMGYSRAELHKTEQPVVKTKEACVRRQVNGSAQMRREAVSARSAGGPAGADLFAQPEIKTKDSRVQHFQAQYQTIPPNSQNREAAWKISERIPSQPLERGRQRFVRERAQRTAERRVKGQGANNVTPIPARRQGVADMPPQASPSGSARPGKLSSEKAVGKARADGKRSIKAVRPGREPIGKPGRQKIKLRAGSPRQTAKAAEHSASAVRHTARAAVQTRQRVVQAANAARRAAAVMGRPMGKAAMAALRGAASAIRAAITSLAAGGGAVIAVVLVLCLVAALIMSPLGIFFGGEETGGQIVADAVREINQEYSAKLEELKSGETYDQLSMSGTRAPWPEVLAVYAVKTTSDPTNGQEVVTMTDEKKELLKQVFWDMNQLSSFTSTVPGEDDGVDTTTLHITVTAKTADEMADAYGFNASQRQQLAELLSDEYQELWNAILYGVGTGSGEIVAVALSQVGNVGGQPYWSWYGFSHRVEWCAIFVSWCANECGYIDAGVIPKFAGCVQGSRWFKDRGLWQNKSYTPNPGDIIFFDWNDPDGFSGPQDGVPDHVGIVEKVENGRVYTVEGNSGDQCCQRSYPVGYYEIYGYGAGASV